MQRYTREREEMRRSREEHEGEEELRNYGFAPAWEMLLEVMGLASVSSCPLSSWSMNDSGHYHEVR